MYSYGAKFARKEKESYYSQTDDRVEHGVTRYVVTRLFSTET